jgi:predicted transcriptional regulator
MLGYAQARSEHAGHQGAHGSEALAAYLAEQEWQIAAIRVAVEEADAGAVAIPHEAVAAWLRSWGTANELPRPR